MDPKPEINVPLLQRKSRIATRAAIFFFFLLAFFWSVSAFFIWLFLGGATYSLFLSWYFNSQGRTQRAEDSQKTAIHSETAPSVMLSTRVKVYLFAVLGIVIVGILARMIISSPADGVADDDTNQSDNSRGGNIDTLTNRGNELYNQGNYDSALIYYNRALAIDEGNQYAMYNKALVYYSKKDYNRAMPILRACLRQHSDYGEAWWLIGDVHYDRKNIDSARICFDRAYQSGLRNGDFLQLMASVYEKENTSRAIELYRESLSQDSTLVEGYRKLTKLDPSNSGEYMSMLARWKK
jgi:tetratricopeptide (TPR) repeat protein